MHVRYMYDDRKLSILHGELSGLGKGPVFSYNVSSVSVYYSLYTVGIYINAHSKVPKREIFDRSDFPDFTP